MNLLGAKLYDPAVAVSKATSALLAMTAFDTTNLRVTVTVPAHGMLYFRIFGGAITGATTVPTVLLGVLNGATVVGRVSPQDFPGTMNAATQSCPLYAEFVVTGLTPGAMSLDLAYAVQVLVASTNIKYGGPNTNAGANAWGGIAFEVWDPQPMTTAGQLSVDANGRVDVAKVAGTAQTARDLGAQLDATVSSRSTYAGADTPGTTTLLVRAPAVLPVAADYTAARAVKLDNLDATVSSRSTYAGADTSGTTTLLARLTAIRAGLLDNLDAAISSRSTYAGADTAGTTTLLARLSAARALLLDNLDAAISSRSTYAGTDTAGTTTLLARLSAARALLLDNMDAAVSSRLAAASYTAPDNADVVAIRAKTDNLPASPADETLIIAATNALSALINLVKAKTDNLPTDPADESLLEAAIAAVTAPSAATVAAAVLAAAATTPIASDVKKVNAVTITGDGNATPWGP